MPLPVPVAFGPPEIEYLGLVGEQAGPATAGAVVLDLKRELAATLGEEPAGGSQSP